MDHNSQILRLVDDSYPCSSLPRLFSQPFVDFIIYMLKLLESGICGKFRQISSLELHQAMSSLA